MRKLANGLNETEKQLTFNYGLDDSSNVQLPGIVAFYPELRYMGSKRRLLPWIHGVCSVSAQMAHSANDE